MDLAGYKQGGPPHHRQGRPASVRNRLQPGAPHRAQARPSPSPRRSATIAICCMRRKFVWARMSIWTKARLGIRMAGLGDGGGELALVLGALGDGFLARVVRGHDQTDFGKADPIERRRGVFHRRRLDMVIDGRRVDDPFDDLVAGLGIAPEQQFGPRRDHGDLRVRAVGAFRRKTRRQAGRGDGRHGPGARGPSIVPARAISPVKVPKPTVSNGSTATFDSRHQREQIKTSHSIIVTS